MRLTAALPERIRQPFPRLRLLAVLAAAIAAVLAFSAQTPDLNALRARAEHGDTEAQNALGVALTAGDEIPRDFGAALQWFRRAADKGSSAASFNLGLAHELGRGVTPDVHAAFRHYLKAAEQGYPPAQYNVGNMYANGRGTAADRFEANLWLRQAADNGVAEAQYNLGLVYEQGGGVKPDAAEAVRWYRLAADQKFPLAQYRLAVLLEDGRGAEKNPAAAALLYRAAAEQGCAPAQNNLAIMYSEGSGGLPENPVEALAWMSLAAEGGLPGDGVESLRKSLAAEQVALADQRAGELRAKLPAAGRMVEAAGANADAPAQKAEPPADADDAAVTAARLRQLREENARLKQELQAASSRPGQGETELEKERAQRVALTKERDDLAAWAKTLEKSVNEARAENDNQQTKLAAVQRQLEETQRHLAETDRALEKSGADVAELTAANERLTKDADNARKSAEAALAAQAQAASAAQPDAYVAEINTLNARIKALETQLDDDRSGAAKEIANLAAQLQRNREANRSLTEANRSLTETKESDLADSRGQQEQAQARLKDQLAVAEELRRQNQKLSDELSAANANLDTVAGQLEDARKVGSLVPTLTNENTALKSQLEAARAEVARLQLENNSLNQVAAARSEALAGYEKLQVEAGDLRRRLAETEQTGRQAVADAEVQLAAARSERDAAAQQSVREAEAAAVRERDAQAAIRRLKEDNAALTARLNQAQGTLDQIAAAARLRTPAARIASGEAPPPPPSLTSGEPRVHVVAEGDSLSRISLRYYGTTARWQEIYEANRAVLQGANTLRVGSQLRIP